jgi:hypothetical protein
VHIEQADHIQVALSHEETSLLVTADYKFGYQSYSQPEDDYLDRIQHAPGLSLAWQVLEGVRLMATGTLVETQYRPARASPQAFPAHGNSTSKRSRPQGA